MSRSSDFTFEVAAEICGLIASGRSLRNICSEEQYPPESTVRGWATDDVEGFSAQYTRAREAQAAHYADRIVDEALTATDASLGRLKMDALKWAASKLAPKVYGEKIAHVGGGEGDAPIRVEEVRRTIVDSRHTDSTGVRPAS